MSKFLPPPAPVLNAWTIIGFGVATPLTSVTRRGEDQLVALATGVAARLGVESARVLVVADDAVDELRVGRRGEVVRLGDLELRAEDHVARTHEGGSAVAAAPDRVARVRPVDLVVRASTARAAAVDAGLAAVLDVVHARRGARAAEPCRPSGAAPPAPAAPPPALPPLPPVPPPAAPDAPPVAVPPVPPLAPPVPVPPVPVPPVPPLAPPVLVPPVPVPPVPVLPPELVPPVPPPLCPPVAPVTLSLAAHPDRLTANRMVAVKPTKRIRFSINYTSKLYEGGRPSLGVLRRGRQAGNPEAAPDAPR